MITVQNDYGIDVILVFGVWLSYDCVQPLQALHEQLSTAFASLEQPTTRFRNPISREETLGGRWRERRGMSDKLEIIIKTQDAEAVFFW